MGGSYMNLQMRINPKTKEGELTQGSDYRFHPYGASAVTAIAAAKSEGECVFATRFGDDTNGKRLYEYYKSCGILTSAMKKDSMAQTGMSVTLFSDLDAHESYLSAGASARFTKEEIDDAFITMPDMFLVPLEELGVEAHTVLMKQPETPATSVPDADKKAEGGAETPDGTDKVISSETVSSYREEESLALYALKKAQERHVDLLLQYTPFTAKFPLETLENIKILVISDEMLYSLTGFFPNTTDKALRSLVALSQKIKSKYYIVQQGDDTAFIYDGQYYETVQAPVPLRTNTKDAGKKMQQTFIGALAAEYLESKNILRACHFATAVSLLTRAKFGNLEKMMSRAELDAYAEEHGISLYQ